MVRKCGYDVNFKEFKIQNIVGVADVNFPIRLEALQIQHKQFCQYEPEVFPGAIYKKAPLCLVLGAKKEAPL